MYPDWPLSDADLVPLPRCEGPKLKPFDFQGPQNIKFLEYVGEGLHSHVFKVQICEQIYALKLFRFTYDENWISPANSGKITRTQMSAFYEYSEPFSCECRAFGRLIEAGHEELAVGCFGYVLLDEIHESAIHSRFDDIYWEGDNDTPVCGGIRSRYLGRDGRLPPIRGIVKQFAPPNEEDELQPETFSKMLADVHRLQQLGIMRLDVASRQLLGGKICDFSTAITVPHFVTTPEVNPHLTPAMRSSMERETFKFAIEDYHAFDRMICEWNEDHGAKKGTIAVRAFPGGNGPAQFRRYELRNKAVRERVFTYVDPRRYDWKRRTKGPRRLRAKPPMWIYYCGDDDKYAAYMRKNEEHTGDLFWVYKDGFIFPQRWVDY